MSQEQDAHHIPETWSMHSLTGVSGGISRGFFFGFLSASRCEMSPSSKLFWKSSVSRMSTPEAMVPLSTRMA